MFTRLLLIDGKNARLFFTLTWMIQLSKIKSICIVAIHMQ